MVTGFAIFVEFSMEKKNSFQLKEAGLPVGNFVESGAIQFEFNRLFIQVHIKRTRN